MVLSWLTNVTPDPQRVILRERAKVERASAKAKRPDAARHAARIFVETIPLQPDDCVALYDPLHDELDTAPLVAALHDRGIATALPEISGRNKPLSFRVFGVDTTLIPGKFGARVPPHTQPSCVPNIIVTPLLAFSRCGDRLGYGGGYYDRTLDILRQSGNVTAVGYAYGAQEVDAIATHKLDQPLDWIVTERGAIKAMR